MYTNRQHLRRIGNFYDQVVKGHILHSTEPSALLSPEKKEALMRTAAAGLGNKNVSLS